MKTPFCIAERGLHLSRYRVNYLCLLCWRGSLWSHWQRIVDEGRSRSVNIGAELVGLRLRDDAIGDILRQRILIGFRERIANCL